MAAASCGADDATLCYICFDDDPKLQAELVVGSICACRTLAVHVHPCLEELVNHPTRAHCSTSARMTCMLCKAPIKVPHTVTCAARTRDCRSASFTPDASSDSAQSSSSASTRTDEEPWRAAYFSRGLRISTSDDLEEGDHMFAVQAWLVALTCCMSFTLTVSLLVAFSVSYPAACIALFSLGGGAGILLRLMALRSLSRAERDETHDRRLERLEFERARAVRWLTLEQTRRASQMEEGASPPSHRIWLGRPASAWVASATVSAAGLSGDELAASASGTLDPNQTSTHGQTTVHGNSCEHLPPASSALQRADAVVAFGETATAAQTW